MRRRVWQNLKRWVGDSYATYETRRVPRFRFPSLPLFTSSKMHEQDVGDQYSTWVSASWSLVRRRIRIVSTYGTTHPNHSHPSASLTKIRCVDRSASYISSISSWEQAP